MFIRPMTIEEQSDDMQLYLDKCRQAFLEGDKALIARLKEERKIKNDEHLNKFGKGIRLTDEERCERIGKLYGYTKDTGEILSATEFVINNIKILN